MTERRHRRQLLRAFAQIEETLKECITENKYVQIRIKNGPMIVVLPLGIDDVPLFGKKLRYILVKGTLGNPCIGEEQSVLVLDITQVNQAITTTP